MNLKNKYRRFIVVLLSFVLLTSCSTSLSSEAYKIPHVQKKIPVQGVKVHFIQLTNGEATLIELENKENILIDTGSYSSQKELLSYLDNLDIHILDHVIITNRKDEHFGNFKDLEDHYLLKNVYYPFHVEEYFSFEQENEFKEHPLKRGDVLAFYNKSKIKVMHPEGELSLSPQDNSLVFQFVHGKNRFLFTSDISERVEEQLVNKFDVHSQILKVCDFGSSQSSSPKFLSEVDAHVAIIFHRPNFYLVPEVLERFEESWMDVYPLKKHGHIVVVSEEDDYELFVNPSKQDLREH